MRILCKCVINNAYGGYALSDAAILWMAANGGLPLMIDEGYEPDDIESGRYLFHAAAFRSLPLLVECVRGTWRGGQWQPRGEQLDRCVAFCPHVGRRVRRRIQDRGKPWQGDRHASVAASQMADLANLGGKVNGFKDRPICVLRHGVVQASDQLASQDRGEIHVGVGSREQPHRVV
ncbi:hypothetical protein EBR57_04455 [bacterium]|nr:hypothetical protein [bacterium]